MADDALFEWSEQDADNPFLQADEPAAEVTGAADPGAFWSEETNPDVVPKPKTTGKPAASDVSPFAGQTVDRLPERETSEETVYKRLPIVTFQLSVNGKTFSISTDDPKVFGSQFAHPAEIDQILANSTRLRSTVHEAYLQAVRRRKIAEKEFDTWKSTVRQQVASTWDATKLGKQTLEAVNDYIKSFFKDTYNQMEVAVWDAEEQQQRLLDLYDAIKQRNFDLKPVAERYYGSIQEYRTFFE